MKSKSLSGYDTIFIITRSSTPTPTPCREPISHAHLPLWSFLFIFTIPIFIQAEPTAPTNREPAINYTRDIRPILSTHCFSCHGGDAKSRKGDLRLDLREEAIKKQQSGNQAIIPGMANDSELYARIITPDESEIMPPPSTKKVLTPAEKDLLKRWINAGAEYNTNQSPQNPK